MDALAYGGHPLSRIGLSEGIERVSSILGEEEKELGEELVQVVRHVGLGAREALWLSKAVPGSDRVVDVDHVCAAIPGVRIEATDGSAFFSVVFIDGADRSVDLEKAKQRRRSGPSLQPHHDRSFCLSNLLKL